jgi:hypothetical protein
MDELFAMGLMGLAVAGGAIGVFLSLQRRAREAAARGAAFRELAARRGGVYFEDARQGVFDEVLVGEVLVRVVLTPGVHGAGFATQFIARYLAPVGPAFVVARHGDPALLVRGGAVVLWPDDGALFSKRYVVVSPQPEATREALTPAARRLLLDRMGPCTLGSDGAFVELYVDAGVNELPALEAGVELVAEVARQPERVLALLRGVDGGLAGALYRPAEGPWEHRRPPCADLELRGIVVRLELVAASSVLVVAARAPRGRRGATGPLRFETCFDPAGRPLWAVPDGVLTAYAAEHLPSLGSAVIRGTPDLIEVVVHGPPSAARLLAAAEVAASLSSDSPASIFR